MSPRMLSFSQMIEQETAQLDTVQAGVIEGGPGGV